jgi:hypothetical protein
MVRGILPECTQPRSFGVNRNQSVSCPFALCPHTSSTAVMREPFPLPPLQDPKGGPGPSACTRSTSHRQQNVLELPLRKEREPSIIASEWPVHEFERNKNKTRAALPR